MQNKRFARDILEYTARGCAIRERARAKSTCYNLLCPGRGSGPRDLLTILRNTRCGGCAIRERARAKSTFFIICCVLVGAPDLVIYRGFCETRVAGGAPSASGHAKSQLFVILLRPGRGSGPRDLRRILRKTRLPFVLQENGSPRTSLFVEDPKWGSTFLERARAKHILLFCFGLYLVIYRTEIRRPPPSWHRGTGYTTKREPWAGALSRKM